MNEIWKNNSIKSRALWNRLLRTKSDNPRKNVLWFGSFSCRSPGQKLQWHSQTILVTGVGGYNNTRLSIHSIKSKAKVIKFIWKPVVMSCRGTAPQVILSSLFIRALAPFPSQELFPFTFEKPWPEFTQVKNFPWIPKFPWKKYLVGG